MKKKSILLAMMMSIALLIGIPAAFGAAEPAAEVYDLTDESVIVSNFTSFYVSDAQGTDGLPADFAENWQVTSDGVKSRKTSVSGDQTGLIKMLTLNKNRYKNFEARLTFQYNDVSNASVWGYPGLMFRQDNAGSGYLADGGLALVNREMGAQYWGNTSNGGGGAYKNEGEAVHASKEYVLHLKVYGGRLEMEILDGESVVSSLTPVFTEPFLEREGFVSIASCGNNVHRFKTLEIGEINSDGTGTAAPRAFVKPSSVTVGNKPAGTLKVGNEVAFDFTLNEGARAADIRYENSNPDAAVVAGGSMTCIGAGSATVTAYSVFDKSVKDSFGVEIRGSANKPNYVNYRLVSENVLDQFVPYYIKNSKIGYKEESWQDHWTYNSENQSVIRKNDLGQNVAEEQAALYLNIPLYTNNKYSELQYFETQFAYRNPTGKDGWVGVLAGNTSQATRFLENGYAAFIQHNGAATVWGKTTGGVYEKGTTGYDKTAWHVMKLRVYAGKLEIYVDNMNAPAFVQDFTESQTPQGRIGIFTSGTSYEIKQISVGTLNPNGTLKNYVNLDSISIGNKIGTAKVGDEMTLDLGFTPDGASYDILSMTSSDSNVCIVNKITGKLTFIGSGTVTITVSSLQFPDVKDTMTVEVGKAPAGEKQYTYPGAGGVGGLTIAGIAVTAVGVLGFAGALVLFLLRRKQR